MRTARMLSLVTLISLSLLAGCQRGTTPVTPVSGRVAYRGNTLQAGTIVFIPDSTRGGSGGPMAFGKINQDGSYHLYTGDTLGAPAGWYRVTVTSLAPSSVQSPGQFNPPYSFLPDKYRDPTLSELSCEIKADRANSIDFNLD